MNPLSETAKTHFKFDCDNVKRARARVCTQHAFTRRRFPVETVEAGESEILFKQLLIVSYVGL